MKESFTVLRDPNVFQNNLWEKILIKENELLKENKLYKKIYHNFESDPLAFDNTLCGLRSPLNIPDIEIGLEYFKEAIDKKSEILIIGDKDVDGVSSTALLSTFIKERHKGKLELIVSDAGDDYGLSGEVYERAINSEAELIFLLDMGTSNGPEIENLYKKNKKVIILDHHLILDRSPDPKICAFLNPVRNLETHKYSHDGKIATVGLVFKFLFAFALSHLKEWNKVYVISNNKKLIAYRVGFYLGVFENISEVQKFLDTEYVSKRTTQKISTISNFEIKQLHKENDFYKFKDNEWDCLVNNKLQGGRILISKIVNYRPKLKNFIIKNSDLAAIGIITDMVPLVDENRSLVKLGIGQSLYNFKKGTRDYRNGISALIKILGLNEERILSRDLGWGIGPALNAAGRMGNTILALELLNADTKISSAVLAKKIINLNENRKRLTLRNELLIKTHFANNLDLLNSPIIFCYHPDLEKGVSGILATRLTEIYQKPVIYINNDGMYARGSARSWDGINVLDILDKLSNHFIQFGGHEQAAGFSITFENIPKFKKAIIEIDPKTLTKKSNKENTNLEIELLIQDLNFELLENLEELEPFGMSNPEPVFVLKNLQMFNPVLLSGGLHLSFQVKDSHENLKFIAWKNGLNYQNFINNLTNSLTNNLPNNLTKNFPNNKYKTTNEILENCKIDIKGFLEMKYFRGFSDFTFRVQEINFKQNN